MTRRFAWLGIASLFGIWSSTLPAAAADSCRFIEHHATWWLSADCQTDHTLSIPQGVTLDGRGHRITAIDPPDGHFLGAIVRNAGTVAHVRNLIVDTRDLTDVCDSDTPPDQRLRGILFEGASGSIVGNHVLDIGQGASACQEGNAIDVRNAPYDGTHPATTQVKIWANRVANYQKTGILVNGDVEADVAANRVIGQGPIDFIAQNGIQLGFGAFGQVHLNRIEQNLYSPGTFGSSGILLLSAGAPIDLVGNVIEDCDLGIALESTSDARVRANRVRGTTDDGIGVYGAMATASGNTISGNWLEDDHLGIDIYGAGATNNTVARNWIVDSVGLGIQIGLGAENLVLHNQVLRSGSFGVWAGADGTRVIGNRVIDSEGVGMHVEGAQNVVSDNLVRASGDLDLENAGDNAYANNRCGSSSGPPVDCP
ncbi:MAG TPA: right-handed parallel beta-helix repeat-containing protein [Polyangiales bacterium]|nr:right-handed parallel beta-helix repeat-containing protein [Polyangiales bacterium]